jgi:transposase
MAFRDRLVKTNVILKNTVKDLKEISGLVDTKFIIKESGEQQKFIERQIQNTERHIELILKEDEQLYKHFKLITSVVGIGLITAVSFLINTQNFTAFENGRQFACYAGIAPFEHRSGSSIRAGPPAGKTKVSPLANRKMKVVRHCGAIK